MDKNFLRGEGYNLSYNGKQVLLVADPEFGSNKGLIDELMSADETIDFKDGTKMTFPKNVAGAIPVDYIRNIYINTQQDALMTYAVRLFERSGKTPFDLAMGAYKNFGCVVFIDFHPDKRAILKTGLRRDIIEGYSTSNVEFYCPDYSVEPPIEPDYRRTLYWNPEVVPDNEGNARIIFSNNSHSKTHKISTATSIISAD